MGSADELRRLLSEVHAVWLPRTGPTRDIRQRIARALAAPPDPQPTKEEP